MTKKLTVEQIAERAEPLSQKVILTLTEEEPEPDLLTVVVALEGAKLALIHAGRVMFGEEFARQTNTLLGKFEGFDELSKKLGDVAFFMQPGGDS